MSDTWYAVENDTTDLPGLTVNDIPRGFPESVRVLVQGERLKVNPKNICGNFALNNGNMLVVRPKYQGIDPVSMLLYIHDSASAREIRDGSTELAEGDADMGLNRLSAMFSSSLIAFASRPKLFRRYSRKVDSEFATGRVDWVSTSLSSRRAEARPFKVTRPQPTFDISENRVIRTAAIKVQDLVPAGSIGSVVINKWARWEKVSLAEREDIRNVIKGLRSNNFGGSHSYYRNSLRLALVILGATGVDSGDSWETAGLVFRMPGLYEDFIRTGLMRKAVGTTLSIQKGFVTSSFLTASGETELIPDITVYRGGVVRAVLDVKYKEVDSKDLYQIYCYMTFAGLREAFIISPSATSERAVYTFDGKRITFLRLNSSSRSDIDELASRVLDLIA